MTQIPLQSKEEEVLAGKYFALAESLSSKRFSTATYLRTF
jgi:hypothetical protein